MGKRVRVYLALDRLVEHVRIRGLKSDGRYKMNDDLVLFGTWIRFSLTRR